MRKGEVDSLLADSDSDDDSLLGAGGSSQTNSSTSSHHCYARSQTHPQASHSQSSASASGGSLIDTTPPPSSSSSSSSSSASSTILDLLTSIPTTLQSSASAAITGIGAIGDVVQGVTLGADSEKQADFWDPDIDSPKIFENSRERPLVYMILTGIRAALRAANVWAALTNDFTISHKCSFKRGATQSGVANALYDFTFVDFATSVFRSMRANTGIEEMLYLESFLQPFLYELRSPGKSGSFFYGSADMKYILKSVTKDEHNFLIEFLPDYTAYLRSTKDSLLIKFFALHTIIFPDEKEFSFIVMENIFPPNKAMINRRFDLKGSTHGREASASERNSRDAIFKDLDLYHEIRDKLHVGPQRRAPLLKIVSSDAKFLAKHNVMDYSLLIGVHNIINSSSIPETDLLGLGRSFRSENGGFRATDEYDSPLPFLYYLGIIDILQTYTARKRMEHSLKSLTTSKEISCVDPQTYCERLMLFLTTCLTPVKPGEEAPVIPGTTHHAPTPTRVGGLSTKTRVFDDLLF